MPVHSQSYWATQSHFLFNHRIRHVSVSLIPYVEFLKYFLWVSFKYLSATFLYMCCFLAILWMSIWDRINFLYNLLYFSAWFAVYIFSLFSSLSLLLNFSSFLCYVVFLFFANICFRHCEKWRKRLWQQAYSSFLCSLILAVILRFSSTSIAEFVSYSGV
jgi:hypothetical protein